MAMYPSIWQQALAAAQQTTLRRAAHNVHVLKGIGDVLPGNPVIVLLLYCFLLCQVTKLRTVNTSYGNNISSIISSSSTERSGL